MMIEILKQEQKEKHKELEAFKEETRNTDKELKEIEAFKEKKKTQRNQRTRGKQNQRDERIEEGI